jgi:hypothetical protein
MSHVMQQQPRRVLKVLDHSTLVVTLSKCSTNQSPSPSATVVKPRRPTGSCDSSHRAEFGTACSSFTAIAETRGAASAIKDRKIRPLAEEDLVTVIIAAFHSAQLSNKSEYYRT